MVARADPRGWPGQQPPEIRTLRPEDVPALRLGPQPKLDHQAMGEALRAWPDRSVWTPEHREYAVAAPWRHRGDISVVQAMVAVRSTEALLRGLAERCAAAGDALALVIELDELRHPRLYARAGFDLLEKVVTFELNGPRASSAAGPVRFKRFQPPDAGLQTALVELDHAAFPWLWWNSEREFEVYATIPGVDIFVGLLGDQPVSYIGVTTFAGWGHLDRIAVRPSAQGQGVGAASLEFAISTLARRGARRIGLSTQYDNDRSRRLYGRFGFRRARDHDYRLYGARLREPARRLPVVELDNDG